MTVYLDLNIFDRLEKIESLEDDERSAYTLLQDLILSKKAITAYSNAHLNDLFRGFQKNPQYTDAHLHNLAKFTNNLCI